METLKKRVNISMFRLGMAAVSLAEVFDSNLKRAPQGAATLVCSLSTKRRKGFLMT